MGADCADLDALTPDDPTYRNNAPVFGALAEALPTEWVAKHDLVDDQVEVYQLGDSVVLRPSSNREAVTAYFTDVLDAETYMRLTRQPDAGST